MKREMYVKDREREGESARATDCMAGLRNHRQNIKANKLLGQRSFNIHVFGLKTSKYRR